jgi:hypothetical protein
MTTTFDDRQLPLTALAAAVEAEPNDVSRLGAIQRLRIALRAVEAETVQAARAEGASWAAIGAQLGISKQAANKRFGATQEAISQAPADRPKRRQQSRAGCWLGCSVISGSGP